jgi:holo-[acyl-carrier protein] synthase
VDAEFDGDMPFHVGIDLVCRDDVQEAVRRHGDRYLDRIYTEPQRLDAGADPLRLAARFAAKEATMKALRGADEPLPWRDIAVHSDADSRPTLHLTGAADDLARRSGVQSLSVSLTHERDLAAAVVVAEWGTAA